MKGERKFIVFLLIVLLVGGAFIFVESEENLVDLEITNLFDKGNERVNVIVSLKEEVSSRKFLVSESKLDKEAVKTKAKEKIDSRKVKHEFLYSNSFSAELTIEEIRELESSGLVEKISYDYPVMRLLQDSVPIINADLTWNLQEKGINLTGKNQTICVIDTGADWLHPALGGGIGPEYKILAGYDFGENDDNPSDYNSHGTHVAGIISSIGSVKGVAPDSNLVIAKVFTDEGSSSGSDILAGMDWCISNSEELNIIGISISLGLCQMVGEECIPLLRDNYCNSYFPEMTQRVDLAFSKNISTIVATSNEGESSRVSIPACIENVTRVTSSLKTDSSLSSFSNRWGLDLLVSPGSSIYSTIPNNLYGTKSGTSMAAPHVSGAVAIVRQYLDSINRTMTPKEIETVLYITGKNISQDGRNYSRIDVYNALRYLDETPPEVVLNLPEDNHLSLIQEQNFSCNLSDWQLENSTLYIWRENGSLYNNSLINNVSGVENKSDFYFNFLNTGEYNWNCLACDINFNCNFASENRSIKIQPVFIDLLEPEEDYNTNVGEINFSCEARTLQEYSLENVSIIIFDVTNESEIIQIYNSSYLISGNLNISNWTVNLSDQGKYNWSCNAYNNNSISYETKNISLIYDSESPNIELISYPEGDLGVSPKNIDFIINITDNFSEEVLCSLEVNNQILENKSFNLSDSEKKFNRDFSVGEYSWKIYCHDLANNENSTSVKTFSLSSPQVTPSSSGGGGGGSSQNILVSPNLGEIISLKTINLKEGEVGKFTVSNNQHTLELLEVKTSSVEIVIRSEPIKIILNKGIERKINLTSPDFYDISVLLNDIKDGKANISLNRIYYQIDKYEDKVITLEEDPLEQENVKLDLKPLIWGFFVFFIVLFLIYKIFRMLEKRENSKKKTKKENVFYFVKTK